MSALGKERQQRMGSINTRISLRIVVSRRLRFVDGVVVSCLFDDNIYLIDIL